MPVQGGEPVRLVSLESLGADTASNLHWSPDGKKLVFQASRKGLPLNLHVYRPAEQRTSKIADGVWSSYLYWSPDSQWISYDSEISSKTRPAGVLWKMDVKAALAKLVK